MLSTKSISDFIKKTWFLNGRKEGNILFNDALNRFYLWFYLIRHTVKDYSESKRENPLLPHGLLFLISKGLLCAQSHRQNSAYHVLCYTNHGSLTGMRRRSLGSIGKNNPTTHCIISSHSTIELHLTPGPSRDENMSSSYTDSNLLESNEGYPAQ